MAAALKLQAENLENKKESFSIVQIAEVVEQLHRLFDATNGPSSNKHKKTKDVQKNCGHHKFWQECKPKLKTRILRA